MGEVILLRDFQQKRDLDRLYAEVTQELSAIVQPFGVDFSAAEPYHAKPEDCA